MKITHCKLKKSIPKKLLEFFVLEVAARSAANLLEINPNSAALFYRKIKEAISDHLAQDANEIFAGEIELDESYFGGKRKGKRGRGAKGKTAVFGMLKREGKAYTVIVENTKTKTNTLPPVIKRKIMPDSVVYTDYYHSYDVLDISEFKHVRINHSTHFAETKNHINEIENFWNQAKRVLRKYNEIDKKSFPLFLKECEFRFNFGTPKPKRKSRPEIV
ncbi:IS1595 family transposase [Avibacterium sp. 20-15]|uniref:IS1595 family transposase n=1 Tax=unclassified Avibacterium TaxID=2685287 RepID=UPI002026C3F2|nr:MULTISPECIES: IS1595 family transposase [unclassified Avibacterium]MCW9734112.1 IS1595 family transposase [Avibacterium sp. 20-15]URL05504.1 IS1595 family transposase [Avibacterium sp. 20-132]